MKLKYDLLQLKLYLKHIRLALLLIILLGIFFFMKYSGPESPQKITSPVPSPAAPPLPEQTGQAREQPVKNKGEISFDEQCLDILYEIQVCILPFSPPADRKDRESPSLTPVPSEQKKNVPPSVVQLKPLQKKQRILPPEEQTISAKALRQKNLPRPVVLLKPSGKKQQTASPAELILPAKALQKNLSRSSRSVVQIKPLEKKQRETPLKNSVKAAEKGKEKNSNFSGKDQQVSLGGRLIPAVQATVAALEAQAIPYGIGPLSDCSGIFHRVLTGVKKWCPDYNYPTPQRYRDSRELARWYHERGELILIRNALAQSDLIRPGMVLFFGRNGAVYKNASVKTLLSPQYGIDHVGVVVWVHKDSTGTVTGYELFHGHGRRGKTTASTTKWHKRNPTRVGYPPLGNGRQQLVAAARIVRAR